MLKSIMDKLSLEVLAMSRTVEEDPLQKLNFAIQIPGLPTGMGFKNVSGLKRELATVEYREGGYSHTRKMKGRETVDPITLDKGMFVNKDIEELYRKSLSSATERNTIIIQAKDVTGAVQREWYLGEAWVKSWETEDFDAESDDPQIEKIVIEFEKYLD